MTQNVALTCTGAIWTRWCLIIKPRNILYVTRCLNVGSGVGTNRIYSLAAVNFFLGVVGVVQVSRIVSYNMSQKGETVGDQVKEAKEDVEGVAKGLKAKAEEAVKS